jgi:TetR/AcrR family transcriptional regulator, regulator of cefoperazone and chloramphenicol sensitivity
MATESQSALDLIAAALPIFGQRGLEGAATREIAKAAGKPMSAITYHFGGKDGLYLACAQHISDTIGGFIGVALADATSAAPTPAEARDQLKMLFSAMINEIIRDETAEFARFIVREQQEPTAAFDIIYSGMMGRVMNRMVELLSCVAGGRMSDLEIRVRALALMGQVMAFRVARATTLRLTGWSDVGDVEKELIGTVIQSHLEAILDSFQNEQHA